MPQTNGTIHNIKPKEHVNDNFSKKEFIVRTDESTQYPQYIRFESHNLHIAQLDGLKVGDKVSVDYNLRGRLKKDDETQCFVSLQAWKIQKV